MDIRFANVTKKFGANVVVDALNLHVEGALPAHAIVVRVDRAHVGFEPRAAAR